MTVAILIALFIGAVVGFLVGVWATEAEQREEAKRPYFRATSTLTPQQQEAVSDARLVRVSAGVIALMASLVAAAGYWKYWN
jgi:uncharacterized membrane protein YiaA